jgi:LmbE family N-acetylglucosaminyl deacetylase
LTATGAEVGKIERIFLFATDREPDIYIDVEGVYAQKLAAILAHQSQFPKGEEDVEWMKELDRAAAKVIGVTYAERFKEIRVW